MNIRKKLFSKRAIIIALLMLCIFIGIIWILALRAPIQRPAVYGVTFVPYFAETLGLDAKEVYRQLLDDLKFKDIRLVAYWNAIERKRGEYDFSNLDWQIDEAQRRGARIVLALGRKAPRWPECHIPGWAENLSQDEQTEELLKYIEATVLRYRERSTIVMWQIENEPFLSFGNCPDFIKDSLDQEIKHVRALDNRPILVTDSGELSLWIFAARHGDVFGTTMYRSIWNHIIGQFEYPLPPLFFRIKRSFTEIVVGKKPMIVIELQGEPWIKKPVFASTIEEQKLSMNPDYFRETIAYANKSGFDTFYLWGVEWWYWMKIQGKPEIWDTVRELVKSTTPL